MKLSCHILDLRVHILLPNGEWRWLNITESPYVIYLDGERETVYRDYTKLLFDFRSGNWREEMPIEDFRYLVKDIIINNFILDKGTPIETQGGNPLCVIDGHHRLAALFHLYGSNAYLTFTDNKLTHFSHGGDQTDSQ